MEGATLTRVTCWQIQILGRLSRCTSPTTISVSAWLTLGPSTNLQRRMEWFIPPGNARALLKQMTAMQKPQYRKRYITSQGSKMKHFEGNEPRMENALQHVKTGTNDSQRAYA